MQPVGTSIGQRKPYLCPQDKVNEHLKPQGGRSFYIDPSYIIRPISAATAPPRARGVMARVYTCAFVSVSEPPGMRPPHRGARAPAAGHVIAP